MAEVESIKKEATAKSIIIKSLIALVLGILVIMLPTPENLTPEGHRLLALLTTVVILWVTEAVPIGVTALLAGAGLILLLNPAGAVAWSVSIWLFFLMQALYFFLVPVAETAPVAPCSPDPFEQAQREALRILEDAG